ncbi:lipopolysaccharide assembly protein LapA domain-containing protein [Inmirania thermothiophila]|uniref:Putative membrane protein n=1 Tax=Inmirania thermothiophila TaxID=1750597 RepID=A0A3N1Y9D7_9GAMM|nr:lipopolysaccharide assembly protein LapA domain-containing protein [Inmirania thermothiophila]ROR35098.1 putative membrane protein [Inmirania thermothiophila]
MRLLRFLVLAAAFVVALGFASINAGPVSIDLYVARVEVPLALALALAFAAGAAVALVAAVGQWLRLRRENARLRRSARLAEQEVANLRAIPIREDQR